MTTYYIMVSKWVNGKMENKEDYSLTRRFEGPRSKSIKLAEAYERELNCGLAWKEAVMDFPRREVMYATCQIPYSQAREYVSFRQWEDCEEYTNP